MNESVGATVAMGPAATLEEMVARAERLVPLLRERAAGTEELRQIPEATLADLHRTGIFRALQPRALGGSELSYRAVVDVCAMLARGCASTAWVAGNLMSHHWMLALWPPEAQDELWGESRDVLIGSAFVFAAGRARREGDGYRLSGKWPFSSGIDPCTWLMVGAVVEQAGQPPEHRMFLLPRADYRIVDTWFVTGLKGTGSKDVQATDAFVPAYRTLAVAETKGGPTPGAVRHPGPVFRVPVMALFPYIVLGPTIGIAEGALAEYLAATRSRVSTYSGRSVADFSTIQLRVAEAAALVDTSRLLAQRNCDEGMAIAASGGVPPLEVKMRWRRDAGFAAGLCTRAVDLLFAASGGAGIYERNPIQRAFRDIHAAQAHYGLSWDVNASMYGRVALGLPSEAPMI